MITVTVIDTEDARPFLSKDECEKLAISTLEEYVKSCRCRNMEDVAKCVLVLANIVKIMAYDAIEGRVITNLET